MNHRLSDSLESTMHAKAASIKIYLFISNGYIYKALIKISNRTDI